MYLIPLITENKWLKLVMGYCGVRYKVFMVFILMATYNIRSIEQLKNIRKREAGLVLGIKRVPSKLRVRDRGKLTRLHSKSPQPL